MAIDPEPQLWVPAFGSRCGRALGFLRPAWSRRNPTPERRIGETLAAIQRIPIGAPRGRRNRDAKESGRYMLIVTASVLTYGAEGLHGSA